MFLTTGRLRTMGKARCIIMQPRVLLCESELKNKTGFSSSLMKNLNPNQGEATMWTVADGQTLFLTFADVASVV